MPVDYAPMKATVADKHAYGYVFYQSVNGVWLTKHVPVKYLKKVIKDEQTCG